MKQVVDKLWELQTVVSQLAEKERNLHEKPESFAEIDREFQTVNEEMQAFQAKLEEAGEERKKIDLELQDYQEILKKYQGQLMQVKNQQQYAAAWKEIDATRKKIKELEEVLLARMAEMEAAQGELDQRSAGYDELKARHDSEYEQWQHSLGDLKAEIEAIKARAKTIEEAIPAKLRKEFHRILEQRQGIAVALVVNDSCSACRVRVRPQAAQQLRRGELIFCEGCRRIFYLESVAS